MITEHLKTGKNNAITGAELAERLSCGLGAVTRAIESERRTGSLICADSNGYYLPADREELADFYKRYTNTLRRRFVTARPFKAALDVVEGQEEIA